MGRRKGEDGGEKTRGGAEKRRGAGPGRWKGLKRIHEPR